MSTCDIRRSDLHCDLHCDLRRSDLRSDLQRRIRRGANTIEFALILPVFVALMAGIFEYGWLFFMRSTVVTAVRSGCRAGSLIPPNENPDPIEVATDKIAEHMERYNISCIGADSSCDAVVATSGDSPTEALTCTMTLEYDPITGLLPTPENLTATTVSLLEIQK